MGSLLSICSNSIQNCNAGVNAPNLTASIITNNYPITTVDLTSITSTNTPTATGVSLAWFTGTPATSANQLTNSQATAQTPGSTYYAAFFDSVNNCYSITTPVTSTVTSPCTGCDTSCPANQTLTNTVNINSTQGKQAQFTIVAMNLVDGNGSNGGTASYHAGQSVTFDPPFEAKAGASVHAYIEGCNSGTYLFRQSQIIKHEIVNVQSENYNSKNVYPGEYIQNDIEVISIFPNPSKGIFKIKINEIQEGNIQVIDSYGLTVYNADFKNKSEFDINIQERPKGIYVVKLVSNEQVFTKKIIKD